MMRPVSKAILASIWFMILTFPVMGIKLNMSRSDVVEVFDWCEDQYQNFLQTLEGDDE